MGTIYSINIRKDGGVPKYPVSSVYLGKNNVEGDKQNDLEYHGGPTRAVCLFSLEKIEALQREGHPIQPGTTGENLTIEGIDWELMEIGSKLSIGEVEIELTGPAPPCKTISESFGSEGFIRISEKKYPGWSRWYASVNKEGLVSQNDEISII
ncbi:MAG: MOSC domain-containing protein [Candidatus Poseidoniales archaeon]|jgi:MOSC domain-containing protein YiiM|tara:strand:+ start:740 stop:1198 length:459 start_codon:yes stop_codon:yes gene_type:complete